jgi:hypothetical protein
MIATWRSGQHNLCKMEIPFSCEPTALQEPLLRTLLTFCSAQKGFRAQYIAPHQAVASMGLRSRLRYLGNDTADWVINEIRLGLAWTSWTRSVGRPLDLRRSIANLDALMKALWNLAAPSSLLGHGRARSTCNNKWQGSDRAREVFYIHQLPPRPAIAISLGLHIRAVTS